MYISSFHIDRFGIFSQVTVNGLIPGLMIFFGQNEAGKSTCMEFLRFMLTGTEKIKADHQGMGSMILNDNEKEIRLTRTFGNEANLFDSNGFSLAKDSLKNLFNGISRDVYRNIFGFSLSELENLKSLSTEEVKNVLYGTTFGQGIRSPSAAIKDLNDQMGKIYKRKGAQVLNNSLKELELIRKKISDLQENNASYDRLNINIKSVENELEELRNRTINLESEKNTLDGRLKVWVQWDQWRALKLQLENLGSETPNITEDTRSRVLHLEDVTNLHESKIASYQHKLEQLRQKSQAIEPDIRLLSEMPLLRGLLERISSYNNANSVIDTKRESLKRQQDLLNNTLAMLGPDWTCERIKSTDRSLFNREEIENSAQEIKAAIQACQASRDELTRINLLAGELTIDIEKITEEIEKLPAVNADLNDQERDLLRQNIAHLEECQRNMPIRNRALENSRITLTGALNLARIKVNPDNELGEIKSRLNKILESQQKALEIAEETKKLQLESNLANAAIHQSEQSVITAQKKLENARDSVRSKAGPGREALETKAKNLKALRALSANIETEKERLKELERRISVEDSARNKKGSGFLIIAAIFLTAGCCIFAANWVWGIKELQIAEGMILPLNLWAAYLAFLCSVIFFGAGMPGNRAEEKKRKQELAQLQSRRETCAMHLAELGANAQQLCEITGVASMDAVTLDAKEARLEREKEQCFHEERSLIELEGLQEEVDNAQEKVDVLKIEANTKEQTLQQARMRWHMLMQDLDTEIVPLPESADTFFARVESARMAYENLENADNEINALWEDLHLIEANINAIPAVMEKLQDSGGELGLLEAAKQTLESCKQADIIQEKKNHLQENLEEYHAKLTQIQRQQKDAADKMTECEARQTNARDGWNKRIIDLGLGENLNPDTVAEAFKMMEACLDIAEKIEEIEQEIKQGEAEINALKLPLENILYRIERNVDDLGEIEWPGILNRLHAEAEEADAQKKQKQNIEDQIADNETELGAEQAALESSKTRLKDILSQSNVATIEEYLRKADIQREYLKISGEISKLESLLAIAANEKPLDEFIKSFESDSKENQQKRLDEINAQLSGLAITYKEKGDILVELKAEARNLEKSEELSRARQEETGLLETIEHYTTEWATLALAEAILKSSKNIYERERQPEILKEGSKIFTEITNGRWIGISASLEDSSLLMLPVHDNPASPETLSRGAREQAYLALRLACIQNHALKSASLPVIMDEVLVNFDPKRTESAINAISNLAKDNSQQIFYFTCQPHIMDLFRKHTPDAPIYIVENRKIMPV